MRSNENKIIKEKMRKNEKIKNESERKCKDR